MIDRIRQCEYHGDYIQLGESKKCPVCEYYDYTHYIENYDWEDDEELE